MALFSASGKYSLKSPISLGEFTNRYLAQAADGKDVELCVIKAALIRSPAGDRIRRQIQLAVRMSQSGVLPVLDFNLEHDPPFVVFESAQNGPMSAVQLQHPLTPDEILNAGCSLAAALTEAHRLGCLPGILAPQRILQKASGEWVMDVTGLSGFNSLQDGGFAGSKEFRFTSPEVAGTYTSTRESEVYSLCAVLDWLISSLPNSQGNDSSSVPGELTEIVHRGLQRDSEQRPAAAELLNCLTGLRGASAAAAAATPEISGSERAAEDAAPEYERTLIQDLPAESSLPFLPNSVGQRLGRFDLHEKLGEGAAGIVFRAVDISDGTVVAIKVLNPVISSNPAAVRRFSREARMLERVNNPCVASLLEFNSDERCSYLVIEYVSGGTLSGAIKELKRLEEQAAVRFILDATRGLAVAHEAGVVHRDVKPENILLTDVGRSLVSKLGMVSDSRNLQSQLSVSGWDQPLAKLSDFGLARIEQQSESMAITRTGTIMGTPLYMAPEQCRGEMVDARADVYAMGATLFHLLAGRPPFEGETHVAIINKQCYEQPPSLRLLCPMASEAVAQIVERCLAKNPDARYSDAGALAEDLDQLLRGQPTSIRLHPATPELWQENVLEFRFSCDLMSSPEQLWPYVSNTDRINHSMGLSSVTYTTRIHPERGSERFAEFQILGQRMVWQEFPYEWVEGRRMSVLRDFQSGPFHWFVNVVELLPLSAGGTRITQTLKASPKGWTGRLIARLQLGRRSPSAFRQVYQHIDRFLVQSEQSRPQSDPFGRSAAISRSGKILLKTRLERLRREQIDPVVVETLGQFIQYGADQEVARIRPLAFAERFRFDPEQAVSACLLGAREGILVLLWDILCPSCQIPADVRDTLAALQSHGYCPACDLKYELDFASSVELIFRAHPELRKVETKTYCVGGPAFSSHVVAQIRMAPEERFTLDLNLGEGDYRIRGPQLPFAVSITVSAAGQAGRWEISLLRPPKPGLEPVLRPGQQAIILHNETSRELLIRLERTSGRRLALTAAAASATMLFRQLFPDEILSPGQIVSMTQVTLMLVDIPSAAHLYEVLGDGSAFREIRNGLQLVESVVKQCGGAVVKIVGEGALVAFSDPSAAIRAAYQLLEQSVPQKILFRIAIHRGPALVTTMNDRLDYFGRMTTILRQLHEIALPGEILVDGDVAEQSESLEIVSRLTSEFVPQDTTQKNVMIYRCRLPQQGSSSSRADL
jgi:serine/threonine protein kinase/class 3 adenylate cyclase